MYSFSLMHNTIIQFTNCGTQCLNRLKCSFHFFGCTTQCMFEPLHVYKPGFNMDKYVWYVDKLLFSSTLSTSNHKNVSTVASLGNIQQ